MTKHPVALAIALALTTSATLSACDRTSSLTEQEHIQRAKDFEDKGDLKAGVIELKNALQKNPDSAQARLLLGEIYLRLGQGEEAEKELSRAEKLGVNPESIKLKLGEAWLMTGDYKRIVDEISPASNATPRIRAAVLSLQGDALLGLRKFEEGCKLYEDSLVADPKHVPAYLGRANCALAKGDTAEARAMIDAAIKINGNDPESWVVLGDFEFINNNYRAATDAYATALKLNPFKLAALFGRAQVYALAEKTAEAKADLETIRELSPNFYGAHFVQAQMFYTAGKTDQALDSVQRSLKSNPGFRPAQLLYALLQYDKQSYENAAKVLEKYLQQSPGHLGARKLLASTYLKLNQTDRTLELLKPYLAAGKPDAQILALAGEAYLRDDDPRSARDMFYKAADLVPTSANLKARLGMSQFAAGNEAEAIEELEATSAMEGQAYKADIALAYHFLAERQYDKALAAIAVLEKKLPDSPGTYNLKGQAYLGKKDYAQARRNFERALALNPTLASAAVRLAMMDIRDKDLAAARKRYQGVLDKDSKSVPAMVGMAELAAIEKKEKEYQDWLEKASRSSPTAFTPRAMLAQYFLGKGETQKALAMATEAVAGRPNNPEALALLGGVQLAAGNKESALSTYTKLATLEPKSATAQYYLAKAHAAAGDAKATRNALRKAVELRPNYVDALTALSALEARTGNVPEATRIARELQVHDASSPLGYALEGDALMIAKRYAEAARLYEQALAKAKGKDSDLVSRRHLALLQSGDAKSADAAVLDWLRTHPQDQKVRSYLARNYAMRGLRQQAIEQYQILSRAVPDDVVVLNNLAVLYQEAGDPRALATAEQVYKLDPDRAIHADTLGWTLVRQGKTERGMELLRKAVVGAPKDPEIRFHYAYALAEMGQKSQARREIDQLQKMKLSPALQQQVGQLSRSLP